MDILGKMVRNKRSVDITVNRNNKGDLIKRINKLMKEYGMKKISKDSNVSEVKKAQKDYLERLNYDILVQAVQEGNTVIASVYGKDTKKSKDKELSRLSKFAPKLAEAKKKSTRKLTNEEKNFLENGNFNIEGIGNKDIITLFEQTKTDTSAKKLIKDVKETDIKTEYYNKELEAFERVFQRVEITREEDLNKLKKHLNSLDMSGVAEETNYLLSSLEMYGSESQSAGRYSDNETELLNARLDDLLIRTGLKKGGQAKVNKTLKKYSK